MTNAAVGGGAAAAAARVQAVRANGVIVRLAPEPFRDLLKHARELLVVHAPGGFFSPNHRYLTSYKGLAFTTDTTDEIDLPPGTEIVEAKKIWIP